MDKKLANYTSNLVFNLRILMRKLKTRCTLFYSSCSTAHSFQVFNLHNAGLLEYFYSFFWVVCLDSSLSQATSPTTQPSRFPFFSTYLTRNLITCNWVWNCPSTPYWEFGLTPLKDSNIDRYFEFYLIFFFSAIYLIQNTFPDCRIGFILILLVLSCLLCQHLVVMISPLFLHSTF